MEQGKWREEGGGGKIYFSSQKKIFILA